MASISAPTGFFSGNVASAVVAEDLQSAIVSAEALVVEASSLAGAIITPVTNPVTAAATVTTIAGTDFVGISQSTADAKITLANLLNGETIDQAPAASAVGDTDTFWTGQGTNVMARQTQSAVWPWVVAKLPSFKRPVIELATNTTLDGTVHNMAILIVTSPITITPNFATMGSGFACDLVNVSGGNVTWGIGITTSGGSTTLSTGNTAHIVAATYSGGSLVFASTGQITPTVVVPGQVTGLTAGTATSSTQPLTWTAPGSGGAPTAYTVQYKLHSSGTWLTFSSAVSGTSVTVGALVSSSSYDFQVIATNSAGAGTASATVTNSTTSGALALPGTTTGLTAGTLTANTAPLTWTAPTTGGAVANYIVQFRVTGAGAWSTFSSGIAGTSTTVTSLSASTSYDFQVAALNATGAGPYSASVTATTAATSNYLLSAGTVPTANTTAAAGASFPGGISVNDNSIAGDGSHTVPTQVQWGYSASSVTPPTTWFNADGQFTLSGHNMWYSFSFNMPATPGTYFIWAQALNGASSVATYVYPFTATAT